MQYLELEVRLLVLKYGYKRVIEALSKAKDVSEHEIQAALSGLERSKSTKQKRRKRSVSEIAEKYIQTAPEKVELLRELVVRFENKTFLPQVMDIRRFLAPFGIDPKSVKSRDESIAKVFQNLCVLPPSELQSFVAQPLSGDSIYSELTNEIMGDRKRSIEYS